MYYISTWQIFRLFFFLSLFLSGRLSHAHTKKGERLCFQFTHEEFGVTKKRERDIRKERNAIARKNTYSRTCTIVRKKNQTKKNNCTRCQKNFFSLSLSVHLGCKKRQKEFFYKFFSMALPIINLYINYLRRKKWKKN